MSDPKVFQIKKNETNNDFHILQNDVIKCAGCNKGLVEVIKVKEDPTRTNIITVECPLCGDTSFRYKIEGIIFISALEGLTITDFPVTRNADNTIFTSVVKVGKSG